MKKNKSTPKLSVAATKCTKFALTQQKQWKTSQNTWKHFNFRFKTKLITVSLARLHTYCSVHFAQRLFGRGRILWAKFFFLNTKLATRTKWFLFPCETRSLSDDARFMVATFEAYEADQLATNSGMAGACMQLARKRLLLVRKKPDVQNCFLSFQTNFATAQERILSRVERGVWVAEFFQKVLNWECGWSEW